MRKREREESGEEEDEALRQIAQTRRTQALQGAVPSDMYIISSSDTSAEDPHMASASALLDLQASQPPPTHTPPSVARLGVPGTGPTPALSRESYHADDEIDNTSSDGDGSEDSNAA